MMARPTTRPRASNQISQEISSDSALSVPLLKPHRLHSICIDLMHRSQPLPPPQELLVARKSRKRLSSGGVHPFVPSLFFERYVASSTHNLTLTALYQALQAKYSSNRRFQGEMKAILFE